MMLILGSAFLYSKFTLFPGWAALSLVIGTLLLIVSAESQKNMTINTVLKVAPMRYTGDISYSLYLWHWLVFVLFYDFQADHHFKSSRLPFPSVSYLLL